MTPVEFRGDLWHQKTRVPVVLCGAVCVILRFAVLVELRLVTDGHRHGHGHRHRPMHRAVIQEAQLSPRDRAMRRVN